MGVTSDDIGQHVNTGVEIVVRIEETLDSQQRKELAAVLESSDGIDSCVFCNQRFHLLLVNYNRHRTSSQDVLARIRVQHPGARLIGPV